MYVCMYVCSYREAVVRWAASIRAHFVARKYTKLVAVVAEEERNRFVTLVKVEQDGRYTITERFATEIQNA